MRFEKCRCQQHEIYTDRRNDPVDTNTKRQHCRLQRVSVVLSVLLLACLLLPALLLATPCFVACCPPASQPLLLPHYLPNGMPPGANPLLFAGCATALPSAMAKRFATDGAIEALVESVGTGGAADLATGAAAALAKKLATDGAIPPLSPPFPGVGFALPPPMS